MKKLSSLSLGLIFCYIMVLAGFLMYTPRVEATKWVVFPVEDPEYGSIQRAIEKADDGDEVILLMGTYKENINNLRKSITIRIATKNEVDFLEEWWTALPQSIKPAEYEIGEVIIDGGQTGSVVTFSYGDNSVLNGVTIKNGSRCGGGGIYCSDCSPTIINCIITENSTSDGCGGGGGVCCIRCPSVSIANCVIAGNLSNGRFGGISCQACSSVTITSSIISGNSALNNCGGIYFLNCSKVTINGCTIAENTAGNNGGGILIQGGISTTITNCTIAKNTATNLSGGGISSDSEGLTISNCTITENSSGASGAGMNLRGNPRIILLTITDCIISQNVCYSDSPGTGQAGGGIYLVRGEAVNLTNCEFIGNSARQGGGMHFAVSSPTITDCVFADNYASHGSGGGISFQNKSYPLISHCTFKANRAILDGGGIFGNFDTSPTIENCIIYQNSATNGGGVHTPGTLVNCLIIENQATNGGGSYGGTISNNLYTNCTFANNSASKGGGTYSSATITNCIYWNDTPQEIYSGSSTISYSNIQGGAPGEGNINADPLFLDQNNDDYHLQSGSPSIDSGTSVGAPDDDLEDNPRPIAVGYDMGAYEYSTFCTSDGECSAGEYCKKEEGNCFGKGDCIERPGLCSQEHAPVCGCDGITYTNSCMAALNGVNIYYSGGGCMQCTDNNQCSTEEYCKKEEGNCEGQGGCCERPDYLLYCFDPIIGCDGNKYYCPHNAAFYGVNVDYHISVMGLTDSAWPCFGHDNRRTGQSPYIGAQSNAIKWKYETACLYPQFKKSIVKSSPAIGEDGTIYIGHHDDSSFSSLNYIYALSGETGELKWKYETGGGVYSSPAIGENGFMYVGSEDHFVYAINSETGELIWKYETGDKVSSSPAIGADGSVYIGSLDGYVYALTGEKGNLKWEYQTDFGVDSSPAIGANSKLYVTGGDSHIYALNEETGELIWKYELEAGVSSPAIGADGTVYVGGAYLYALNGDTGELIWKFQPTNYAIIYSKPSIGADGTVYFGSEDGYVYAIKGEDGAFKWKYKTNGFIFSSAAIGADEDDTVYIGSYDNHIYALNGETGKLKWRYETEGAVHSSPAIGLDETVYVGSCDGYIYAFGVEIERTCPLEMVSYWTFDDSSNPGKDYYDAHDGTVLGATWTSGLVNGALSFNGSSEYIRVSDTPFDFIDNTHSFSIEAWIYPTASPLYCMIVAKHAIGRSGWWFGTRYGKLEFGSQGGGYATSKDTVVHNEWQHVVATYNGSRAKVYHNGTLWVTGSNSLSNMISDYDLDIGRQFNSHYWNGLLDEVAIYSRALTEEEIQQHYQNGLEGYGYCDSVGFTANVSIIIASDVRTDWIRNTTDPTYMPEEQEDIKYYKENAAISDISPKLHVDVTGYERRMELGDVKLEFFSADFLLLRQYTHPLLQNETRSGCDFEVPKVDFDYTWLKVIITDENGDSPVFTWLYKSVSMACTSNDQCTEGEYCKKEVGDCDGQGVCVTHTEICTYLWDPVCGCDGKTYANACLAGDNSINIDCIGECEKPNITPYKPSGWDDAIVVSKQGGTYTDDLYKIIANQTAYIDCTCKNNGNAVATEEFSNNIYIDGALMRSWTTDANLAPNETSSLSDYEYIFTTCGVHNIKLICDADNTIGESNEENNIYVKNIDVCFGAHSSISISSYLLDFGDVCINTSKTKSFKIGNDGEIDFIVFNINFQQDGFKVNQPEMTIKPGEEKEINVIFSPQSAGNKSNSLDFSGYSYVAVMSLPISLHGRGISLPCLDFLKLGSDSKYIRQDQPPESVQFKVPIYLDISEDIFSIKFKVLYDTTVLTATSIDKASSRVTGSLAPNSIDDLNGRIIIGLIDLYGQAVIKSGEGKIFDLIFSLDQAQFGSFPLEIIDVEDVYATDGIKLTLATQNGEINIIQPPCCTADVDNDCDLDVFDLVFIYRYLQGFSKIVPDIWRTTNPNIPPDGEIIGRIEECLDCFDVDNDGDVDVFDLVFINRCLQGFPVIVLPGWSGPPDEEIIEAVEKLKPLILKWPMPGVDARDWVINNYVDLDSSSGVLDYLGGSKSYNGHNGVDIDIPTFREMDNDFPIIAAAPGTVVALDDGNFDRNTSCTGSWNFVTLEHANGWRTIYGHLKQSSVVVTVGQTVAAGEKLGVVGSSGCSTQPHLHFEVRDASNRVVSPFLQMLWENPPVYNTPFGFMDATLYAQPITDIDKIKDPAPNITQISPGQTLGVGLSMAGGSSGDRINLQFLDPSSNVVNSKNINFAQVNRHTYWFRDLPLPASAVKGTYTLEIRLNGTLTKSYNIVVGPTLSGFQQVRHGIPGA